MLAVPRIIYNFYLNHCLIVLENWLVTDCLKTQPTDFQWKAFPRLVSFDSGSFSSIFSQIKHTTEPSLATDLEDDVTILKN